MVIHVVSAVYRMQFMRFFSQAEAQIKQEMIAFGWSREGSTKLPNSFHTMHERELALPLFSGDSFKHNPADQVTKARSLNRNCLLYGHYY